MVGVWSMCHSFHYFKNKPFIFKGASKGHPSLLNTIGPSPHHGSLGHVDVTLYLMNQGPFCEALSSAPENCSGNVALILKFYSSCLSKLETFFTMLN